MNSDWQLGLQAINKRGACLLRNQHFSDVRFLIGQEPNQKIILGHKLILAMASPVFECMFYGQLATKSNVVSIPDISPDAFINLLEYIYSDLVNITTFEQAYELCYVAKKYMLPHFFDQCTQYMITHLNPVDACRGYECGKLFDEQLLMQESMKIIAVHTHDVINDPSFMNVDVNTLMDILDQDELSIESELDLFNVLIRFAEKRCDRKVSKIRDMKTKEITSNKEIDGDKEPPEKITKPNLDYQEIAKKQDTEATREIKMELNVFNRLFNETGSANNPNGSQIFDIIPNSERSKSPDVVVVESDESIESPVASTSGTPIINKMDGNFRLVSSTSNGILATSLADNFHQANTIIKAMTEEELNKAIKKIRYLSMTPQQFAEGPARSNYLSHHEALTLLILITCPSMSEITMPEGFCTSRSMRNSCTKSNTMETETPQILNTNLYCIRAKYQQYEFHNANMSDSSLTFQVDRNIWITGIEVPSQLMPRGSDRYASDYTEILYAHIQHLRGSRIRYVHLTFRVDYEKVEEVTFDHPVYIHANQIYKIFITFNKEGRYPMYSCLTETACNDVNFKFNVGCANESVRDGLIHGIIFQIAESN